MASGLVEKAGTLLEANRADLDRARGRVTKAFLDRLTLTEARIEEMAQGLREIAALPDPVGRGRVVAPARTGSRSRASACRWA